LVHNLVLWPNLLVQFVRFVVNIVVAFVLIRGHWSLSRERRPEHSPDGAVHFFPCFGVNTFFFTCSLFLLSLRPSSGAWTRAYVISAQLSLPQLIADRRYGPDSRVDIPLLRVPWFREGTHGLVLTTEGLNTRARSKDSAVLATKQAVLDFARQACALRSQLLEILLAVLV